MTNLKRSLWFIGLLIFAALNKATAQLAQFSFGGPSTVSGWTNIPGDPYTGVRTATAGGITISTISTGNWAPNSVPSAEYDFGGASPGVYFPDAVMSNSWLQYNGSGYNLALYNAAVPQLQLSGLNKDSTYILRMTGSDRYYTGNTQYTVVGLNLAGSQQLNTYNNTTQGVTFTHVQPDASGTIRIYVNATSNALFAFISGVQVFPGSANVGVPVVALTAPANGTNQSEGGNLVISATASEAGGSIAKVEFYADTTKIGEDDTAPYTLTWTDPDPATYQITAKATDAIGTIATASVNVKIQSLNYFWSTSGNIATGGDSNFVGTVDSNRLSFRTKNTERMTISAIGNVGIGTSSPTAQLHTTGSVRLAGLGNDSGNVQPRMLVSDSNGKIYYRSIATGGLNPGQGLGGSSGGLALGDSIPGQGPHSFNSNRYQYLNGHQYSIGGSVNDPVNRPTFRMYDNGDLAAGTTMDLGVTTTRQAGLRYYSKLGILQIGASDRLDTTMSRLFGAYEGSGILINSDETNTIKGRIYSSIVSGDGITIDSAQNLTWSIVSGESIHLAAPVDHSFITGYGHTISASASDLFVTGNGNVINKPSSTVLNVNGFQNSTADTARGSFVGGAENQYGGLFQFTSGVNLANRSPAGTAMGSGNVDFSTLSYTGLQGISTPNLARYPLFVLGNAVASLSTHSNAMTVMYNGRTQINTTGYTNTLTQTQVTPQAALDVVSTNTGVLLPRLTTAQRNAIVSADLLNGLLLYNTDSSAFQYYNGNAWNSVGSGGSGSGRWLFAGGTAYDSLDNIGIGTSNPQGYKLAVNGTAMFTKVKVKAQANWPDYVFKTGYKLPDLEELETYISKYHHLPGIASEDVVNRSGIDLGDQQTALLKKVEELTLYLIGENRSLKDQNKQISEQNARLEAQQKEIDELKAMIQANNSKH